MTAALDLIRAQGCDAENPPIYISRDGFECRCVVCPRCNHHTGNATQGHWWAYCKATRTRRDHHFCCPGNCELETGGEQP